MTRIGLPPNTPTSIGGAVTLVAAGANLAGGTITAAGTISMAGTIQPTMIGTTLMQSGTVSNAIVNGPTINQYKFTRMSTTVDNAERTTSGTTFASFTNSTCSITVDATANVHVQFSAAYCLNNSVNAVTTFQLLRGTNVLTTNAALFTATAASGYVPVTFYYINANIAPGTYDYIVQWKVSAGTATKGLSHMIVKPYLA